jgi:hypothetical protein
MLEEWSYAQALQRSMLTRTNGCLLVDYSGEVNGREKTSKKMRFGAADVEENLWRMATDVAASLPLVHLHTFSNRDVSTMRCLDDETS